MSATVSTSPATAPATVYTSMPAGVTYTSTQAGAFRSMPIQSSPVVYSSAAAGATTYLSSTTLPAAPASIKTAPAQYVTSLPAQASATPVTSQYITSLPPRYVTSGQAQTTETTPVTSQYITSAPAQYIVSSQAQTTETTPAAALSPIQSAQSGSIVSSSMVSSSVAAPGGVPSVSFVSLPPGSGVPSEAVQPGSFISTTTPVAPVAPMMSTDWSNASSKGPKVSGKKAEAGKKKKEKRKVCKCC